MPICWNAEGVHDQRRFGNTWSSPNARRLKSRHPVVPTAWRQHRAAHWADQQWDAEWTDNPTRLRIFIPDTRTHPPGVTLPRRACVRFKPLRTGVGIFRSCLYIRGTASSAACECGAEQTVDHVVLQCPIHRPSHGLYGLTVLNCETIEWLLNTCPDILCGQAVVWTSGSKEEEPTYTVWHTRKVQKLCVIKLKQFPLTPWIFLHRILLPVYRINPLCI